MANIWRKDDNVKEQPKRNIMDLSFQNNLTTQFGKLVPVFCKEFIPGDSFSIQPTFSLKFQPMVFPIQTRMRAYLHFFKVRNRNLWKDWEDFIAKNKENLDPPYLDTAVTQPITGSLLDYLGVPTTITGSFGNEVISKTVQLNQPNKYCNFEGVSNVANVDSVISSLSSSSRSVPVFNAASTPVVQSARVYSCGRFELSGNEGISSFGIQCIYTGSDLTSTIDSYMSAAPKDTITVSEVSYTYDRPTPREDYTRSNLVFLYIVEDSFSIPAAGEAAVNFSPDIVLHGQYGDNGYVKFVLNDSDKQKLLSLNNPYIYVAFYNRTPQYNNYSGYVYLNSDDVNVTYIDYLVGSDDVRDIDGSNSPYWRSGATTDLRERIKLSALPCRAYEQIYNSFYRNAENNPYILNGVPEYNKYMPTDEGGVDANLYDFYYRNWEDDFLTTALQQPQAGIAPLVGLTGTAGTATVTLADEDGNVSEATAQYDEDGNVLSVTSATNTSLTEALADAVTYGISINDLRNVNAFQRWLEAKARGGYKYRDVIETMFGITVRYDTLDMPEFIGGTSLDIMVNQISQTVPTETSPLGDYAGQASGIGTGKEINEYFDEHGFVIGILSVVPVPNYSQLLPKHFIKRDAFDYYFPQFGHIGMQPIKYDEVCPIQAYQDSTEQNNVLDETFGYQRAWYDYLASTDEVHGEFRTNLRNFVMNRTFDVKPELVNSFLTVDPKQLNDVFAIQDDSYDKILGQIYFNVKAKRPIPLYGIPKLE